MGRYVVEGLLGPGGVTETYLARLSDDAGASDRLFALKLLRRDRVPESVFPEVARRFVAAGQRLRGFQRPGFGKVVDVSDEGEATFIVGEYFPGHDLERLLALSCAEGRGRIGVAPELAGLLGAEVARLLQVAHTAKPSFPHLGLAPRNVMVSEDGEVVLLDAGIAAAIRPLTEQPPERDWFLAPELRKGDAAGIRGSSADLYSLGALLHYLIAGRPPGERLAGSSGASAPPSLPELSPRLSAVLRGLLAERPEDRPEAAGAVVDRLSGGADSVRRRQRRIARGLHQAEEEARAAAARQHDSGAPPEIRVPRPADSMVADALARAMPGLGRRRDRRRVWAATLFATAGVAVAAVSFVLSTGAGRGTASPASFAAATEPGAGRAQSSREAEISSAPPSRERILGHLAGHLVAETVPPGATVWVDGVSRGRTFADVEVGPGRHRIVLTLPGYRTFRQMVDTGPGAIIRRNLEALPPPKRGIGFVRVECQTMGKFPILLDDEETGFLCPELRLAAPVGKHTVGIYLPESGKVVSIPITVEPGAKTAIARFTE
jgi:hypothetical protein